MSDARTPTSSRECAEQIVNIIKFDTPHVVEGNPPEFHVGRIGLAIDRYVWGIDQEWAHLLGSDDMPDRDIVAERSLKQARADALREAADWYEAEAGKPIRTTTSGTSIWEGLRARADELEKQA